MVCTGTLKSAKEIHSGDVLVRGDEEEEGVRGRGLLIVFVCVEEEKEGREWIKRCGVVRGEKERSLRKECERESIV